MSQVQRRHERREVDWIAFIRLADGTDYPCAITDVSEGGLKISAGAEVALPDTFLIKVVGRKLVIQVKQAWRRGHNVGVRIEKIGKLSEAPSTPVRATPEPDPPVEVYQSLGSHKRFREG